MLISTSTVVLLRITHGRGVEGVEAVDKVHAKYLGIANLEYGSEGRVFLCHIRIYVKPGNVAKA